MAVLAERRATTVIAVGYGPGGLVTPVIDAFAAAARRRGLAPRELLRAEDGRYWSYLCPDVTCCPAEGVPFDTRSHPVTAVMSAAGLAAYPDRAALERTLAPLTRERHGQGPGDTAGMRAGRPPWSMRRPGGAATRCAW